MLHHYITKYFENGTHFVESWLQLKLFGLCFCFSRKRLRLRREDIYTPEVEGEMG